MFSQACVKNSVRGGGCLLHCMLRYTHTPLGRHPPADTPPPPILQDTVSTSGPYTSYWNAYLILPATKLRKVMFLYVSVILFTGGVSVPACTTGHMTMGVSVQGVSVPACTTGHMTRGVCPMGLVQGGLCWGGLCPRGVCPGGWSRGVSVHPGVSLCGVSVRETPHTVTSGWYASYWNAFSQASVILLTGGCLLPGGACSWGVWSRGALSGPGGVWSGGCLVETSPPPGRPLLRARLRILLECILVTTCNSAFYWNEFLFVICSVLKR